MKKVRLLCLLALLFAVGSAFKTSKQGETIYPVSDGEEGFIWVTELPDGDCIAPPNPPCFIQLVENAPIPEDNELPPSEDIEEQSEEEGVYPAP